MSANNSTETTLDCTFDHSTIFNFFINWIIILLGLLATIVNSVITKTSFDLNRVIEKRAKTNRYATLPSLARSHSITYFFLIHQSTAHALVSSTLITQTLLMMYHQLNYGVCGLVICIFKEAALLASFYQLIYIVMERYWSLVFPLRSASALVSKRTIYSMWLLGVLLCIPDKLSLLDMDISLKCATVWLVSLTRFSNHYFQVVSIIPVVFVTLGCISTLHFLRNTQASKMFTYNKSVKALKSAVNLTQCEMLVLLVYAIPLGFFSVSSYVTNSHVAVKVLRCSYLLLSCNSVLHPVTVLYNYGPIRRKVKTVFHLYHKRSYRMRDNYMKDGNRTPIILINQSNYKTTEL